MYIYHCFTCPSKIPSAAQTPAELWSFPDRTTAVGDMIDTYLSSKQDLDDAAIHLLFSANRWEKQCAIISLQPLGPLHTSTLPEC